MFIENSKPILFIIESKERGNILEPNIGVKLKAYIEWLLRFSPSVHKSKDNEWHNATEIVNVDNFELISVGAYIVDTRYDNESILRESKCDLLFLFSPDVSTVTWKLKILSNKLSIRAENAKLILYNQLKNKKKGLQVIE